MLLKTLLIFTIALCAESYKILGIFPMPAISHYILASKLMKGLGEAGHDVTMVSPYNLKDPPKTYKDVILDGYAENFTVMLEQRSLFEHGSMGPIEKLTSIAKWISTMVNDTLNHPKILQLTKSNEKFDVVIIEQFNNDALKVFGHIFQCPLILLSTIGPNSWVNDVVGNPQPISYAPHLFGGDFSKDLSFLNRAKNLFWQSLDFVATNFVTFPIQEELVRTSYPEAPPLSDLYHNVSLILLNSHISLYPALPTVPNMIEIGGYFIDPPKKLPEDLQVYLDNAKDGAVYFSMGSNLKSKDMPQEKKQAILNVLGKLKQKVIWKFEEDLPGKPKNVMIRKWCPQQDILAHPNIKLFITHGGLLSTTETIYHGVPILVIPVFGDQPANAARAVASGYGLSLNYFDPNFNEENLSNLINELLTNTTYRDTVKEKSRQYHDRPLSPMKTAVYWVEYVIRHKGAPHLMVAGVKLPRYKYYMLDVLGAILASIVLVFYVAKLIVKAVFSRLFCNRRKNVKSSTKVKKN